VGVIGLTETLTCSLHSQATYVYAAIGGLPAYCCHAVRCSG